MGLALTPEQLHVLQHSLGCDQYGNSTASEHHEGGYYRNRYVCDSGDPAVDSLVAVNLMKDCGPSSLAGGMHLYVVTPEGVAAMKEQSPKAPTLTRAQRRYRQFLQADCGYSFREWLRYMEEARKDGRLERATGSRSY